MTPIRIQIARDVRSAARLNNDAFIVAACNRVIDAWRYGTKADKADWQIVYAFEEAV